MARLTAGIELSGRNFRQCDVMQNFARGVSALSDRREVQYKCTGCFGPADEIDFLWSNAAIGITGPGQTPEKDRGVQPLAVLKDVLRVYGRGTR